jgi:hypothetical protein
LTFKTKSINKESRENHLKDHHNIKGRQGKIVENMKITLRVFFILLIIIDIAIMLSLLLIHLLNKKSTSNIYMTCYSPLFKLRVVFPD